MSMNFDTYVKDANTITHRVADALGIEDRQQAARIFRTVLHAVRDRVLSEEALHLGAHLSIIWKGIYFDGYSISHRPVNIRSKEEWLSFICTKDSTAAINDFPTLEHAHAAFQDIMFILEEILPAGEFGQVFQALHKNIQSLVVENVSE